MTRLLDTIQDPSDLRRLPRAQLQNVADVYVCEQASEDFIATDTDKPIAVLVGPEGGWSDAELALFEQKQIKHYALHDFTLRAETACLAVSVTLGA